MMTETELRPLKEVSETLLRDMTQEYMHNGDSETFHAFQIAYSYMMKKLYNESKVYG